MIVIKITLVIDNTHQSVTIRTSRINHMRNTMRGACVSKPLPTLNAVSLCARACFLEGLNIFLSSASMFIIYCVKKCVNVCNYIRIYVIETERYYFGKA